MPTDQLWLLGLVIGLLAAVPVVGIMVLTEVRKFAGFRKKLAEWCLRNLPFAVTEPFERVYGSDRVRLANRKALLAAKTLGRQQAKDRAKALKRNNIRP